MPDVNFPANGSAAPGYLAIPEERGPAVIVLAEWWGVDSYVRDVCDRFAVDGFVALAPDVFRGRTASDLPMAKQLADTLDVRRAEGDVRAAVRYLTGQDAYDGSGVGTVGFCVGGGLSIRAANVEPELEAVVAHYALLPGREFELGAIQAPVLGHFGTADEFVPVEDARRLERALRAAGVDARFELYRDARHGFCNSQLGTYDRDAANLAWRRTVRFLRQRLHG